MSLIVPCPKHYGKPFFQYILIALHYKALLYVFFFYNLQFNLFIFSAGFFQFFLIQPKIKFFFSINDLKLKLTLAPFTLVQSKDKKAQRRPTSTIKLHEAPSFHKIDPILCSRQNQINISHKTDNKYQSLVYYNIHNKLGDHFQTN
jgi:hypothetical protein